MDNYKELPRLLRVLESFECHLEDNARQILAVHNTLGTVCSAVTQLQTSVNIINENIFRMKDDFHNQHASSTAQSDSNDRFKYLHVDSIKSSDSEDLLAEYPCPEFLRPAIKIVPAQNSLVTQSDLCKNSAILRSQFQDENKESLEDTVDCAACANPDESLMLQTTIPSRRRTSILITAEEANKRGRLQRIHSRLLLLNPKKLTWAYVCTHLSRPDLRRVLWKDFLRVVFGIQEGQPSHGIDGSTIIHPSSPFHTCVETACVLLLIATVFVVPMELSFWSMDDSCSITSILIFNMAVDLFFIFDLVYRFFVGVFLPGGIYVDRLGKVAKLYLSSPSGFWFNLATSIPFGWIDWALLLAVCDPTQPDTASYTRHMALARAMKPVRALKLVRLLRASTMWGSVLIALDLPPVVFRALKTACLIIMSLHLSACGFWLLKLDTDRPGLDLMLSARGLEINDCVGCYVLVLYFIVTIFATGEPGPVAGARGRIPTHLLKAARVGPFAKQLSCCQSYAHKWITCTRRNLYNFAAVSPSSRLAMLLN